MKSTAKKTQRRTHPLPRCNKILKLFVEQTGINPGRAASLKVGDIEPDFTGVTYFSYHRSRRVPIPRELVELLKKHLQWLPRNGEQPMFPSKSDVSRPISGRMARYICEGK